MKHSIFSRIDKIVWVILLVTIFGILLSFLVDPGIWLGGTIYLYPLPFFITWYFLVRNIVAGKGANRMMIRGFITGMLWCIAMYFLVSYIMSDYQIRMV